MDGVWRPPPPKKYRVHMSGIFYATVEVEAASGGVFACEAARKAIKAIDLCPRCKGVFNITSWQPDTYEEIEIKV